MPITLNIVKPDSAVEKAVKAGYLYKDIQLDLVPSYTTNNELFKSFEKDDLKPLYDMASVINSVKNILITSPGEKILNPTFGLDLRDYLFEPVSDSRAFFIGRDILRGLVLQEPRIDIDRINIEVNEDEQEYTISLDISVPSLNAFNITLRGVLNMDGYVFV